MVLEGVSGVLDRIPEVLEKTRMVLEEVSTCPLGDLNGP